MAKQAKAKSAPKTKGRVRNLTRKDKKQAVRATKKLPNSFVILGRSMRHIWRNKKLFAGILLVFAVFYLLLVKGLASNFQLSDTRRVIEETMGDEISTADKSLTLFETLLGTTGNTAGEAAGAYQTFLFVIFSLVIIWSLRQTFEGKARVKLKDAFYKSMSPFVTYCIVGFVILLQSLPALIGLTFYGAVAAEGLAVGTIEQAVWFVLMLGGLALSAYWISSSLFASYIVTLPDMTPLVALQTARKLVRYRRLNVIRKFLFLPLFILLSFAVIFLPLVLVLPLLAEILFFILSVSLILIGHTYFYVLYRELL